MQCKVRRKHCSFTRTDLQSNDEHSIPENSISDREKLADISSRIDKLSMTSPGQGREGRWLVDINLLFHGDNTIKNRKNTSAVHDTIDTDMINLFFEHKYNIFPIIQKSIFYRLLEHQDPLITPCLLYSIYCHGAQYKNMAKADDYYQKAEILVRESLRRPSIATVISLSLLSMYESNGSSTGSGINNGLSRIYRDMACRLCYDLKLHKRCSSNNAVVTLDEMELRKRAYWVCYCMDKINSMLTGKPCLLSLRDADIDMPTVLSTGDPNELDINRCFLEHIRLMKISEQALLMDIPEHQAGTARLPENEQQVLTLDHYLSIWFDQLPPILKHLPLQEGGLMEPFVAHIRLVYCFVAIFVLQPITFISSSCSSDSKHIQQRCRTVANEITCLGYAMVHQPNTILSFTLLAQVLMAATRVHIMDCADENLALAKEARFMFQQSLRALKGILQFRIVPYIFEFTATVEKALRDADTGDSCTRNSSPKVHMLSPIYPKPTSAEQDRLLSEFSQNRFYQPIPPPPLSEESSVDPSSSRSVYDLEHAFSSTGIQSWQEDRL
ncbi:Nitrogen assimilation transcription factor nirA [Choanephora cucurbitarum]|uniref:Nitrogen assimilation transcription factor nirA n=1 Tax=Choanephora cucurbitarum TaxID=101091 RepID=A0A1C7NPE3_9FUNG|nr:Nitrogen assimilation transcription factor nirA [Choanephora cucurbitarum]